MLFNIHCFILVIVAVFVCFYIITFYREIGLTQNLGKDSFEIFSNYLASGYSSALPSHPWLNQSCYVYANLSADNICCEARNYTSSAIHTCTVEEVQDINLRYEALHAGTRTNRSYWVFNGNSRVRFFFQEIVQIFGADGNVEKYMSRHISGAIIGNVTHKTIPINFTLFWDPLLDSLPGRVDRWLKYPKERPTRLHIGHGVNHMHDRLEIYNKFGQEAAAKDFKESVRRVVPALQELSKYTHISWWTSEYMVESKTLPKFKNVWSRNNIDYYNNFLKEQLCGTNIAVMDAHVSLGELYIKSCTANFVADNKRCIDQVHQGTDANGKYANMFINHACSVYGDHRYKQMKSERFSSKHIFN